MTKNLGLLVALAVVAWLLLRKKAPAVAGEVSSGSKSITIDTNVLSQTFGLSIDANGVPTGNVAASPETP